MKLRRFVAADMRSALALIKAELGPDAVIMSNKRVDDGVEIVAGVPEEATPKTSAQVSKNKKSAGPLTAAASAKDSPLSRYLEERVGDDDVSLSAAPSDAIASKPESVTNPTDSTSFVAANSKFSASVPK